MTENLNKKSLENQEISRKIKVGRSEFNVKTNLDQDEQNRKQIIAALVRLILAKIESEKKSL